MVMLIDWKKWLLEFVVVSCGDRFVLLILCGDCFYLNCMWCNECMVVCFFNEVNQVIVVDEDQLFCILDVLFFLIEEVNW